jgi:nicotinamidase-related amidase
MPLSGLDPTVALVVVDLQEGTRALPAAHPIADAIARSAELAHGFRAQGLPVVLVTVTGGAPGRTEVQRAVVAQAARAPEFADLVPELAAQPTDHRLVKTRWGAFTGTSLDDLLRGAGVTQVVLTGVATSIGVESTARSAYELGYNVVLVTDAMTDMNADAHANSIERIFPRLGETTATADVLAQLAVRS